MPEKGFCELTATDKMVIIGNICGDGLFWKNFAELCAKHFNLKACGTICCRKEIRAWIKLFGFEIKEIQEREQNLKTFICIGRNGGWLKMSEYISDAGNKQAFCTWEVV